MSTVESAKLIELLCKRVRRGLGAHLAELLVKEAPFIQLMSPGDQEFACSRILEEMDDRCSDFVANAFRKLRNSPATLLEVPPTIE